MYWYNGGEYTESPTGRGGEILRCYSVVDVDAVAEVWRIGYNLGTQGNNGILTGNCQMPDISEYLACLGYAVRNQWLNAAMSR